MRLRLVQTVRPSYDIPVKPPRKKKHILKKTSFHFEVPKESLAETSVFREVHNSYPKKTMTNKKPICLKNRSMADSIYSYEAHNLSQQQSWILNKSDSEQGL